jgi:hypothetical protein
MVSPCRIRKNTGLQQVATIKNYSSSSRKSSKSSSSSASRLLLVSEMDDDFVRSIFLNPQPSAQEAFDQAMAKYGPDATVIAMPFGGATLPIVEE